MSMLSLSPSGRLHFDAETAATADIAAADIAKDAAAAFARGSGDGLLFLESAPAAFLEESVFVYWQDFARRYLSLFAATPDLDNRNLQINPIEIALPADDLDRFARTVPPMKGADYVSEPTLTSLWSELGRALQLDIARSKSNASDYFERRNSGLRVLGRVCFHLAENKNAPDYPFAFLATYAQRAGESGRAQHVPLGRALEENAGPKQKNTLLRLLSPIQRAAQESGILREVVASGEIYHPLAWGANDAHRFLKDVPIFEKAGIAVRVPDWWKARRARQPQVTIRVGEKEPSGLGLAGLVDFSLAVVLGESDLDDKDMRELLAASDRLIFFKGHWVEVDKEKLNDLLAKWKDAADSFEDGIGFGEAMRLLAADEMAFGMTSTADEVEAVRVVSGSWLKKALDELRSPHASEENDRILREHLRAELRPYQRVGVNWLRQLNGMNLGGVLADDMGLGKTIQVIALLLLKRYGNREANRGGNREANREDRARSLLVVPASLIGNWKNEIAKFAPSLRLWIAHASGDGYAEPQADFDVALATYGSLARLEWIERARWSVVVADEAQAIKNPTAKQTKSIKKLRALHRLALTGTPVENSLADLWSLFDFTSPGLLGTSKDFQKFLRRKKDDAAISYGPLRALVRPYILRRMKTDKAVIQDLPDKTEMTCFCQLSRAQATLYQSSVESLARDVANVEGMQRRGVILSYLMRFKQICNHPSQLLKDGDFSEGHSGKFRRLREICEVIAAKQEKVLVFTQFKEMAEPLRQFLDAIFGKRGVVLHGETPVKKRAQLVADFQREDGPPHFVLSLKAGGTGLNLTAATHVIHFDRWWNPATENQATDRAFRIGQKKNVVVHAFVCKGTLEDKIAALIESKRALSKEVLEDGAAAMLTEATTDELLKIVALDAHSALGEF